MKSIFQLPVAGSSIISLLFSSHPTTWFTSALVLALSFFGGNSATALLVTGITLFVFEATYSTILLFIVVVFWAIDEKTPTTTETGEIATTTETGEIATTTETGEIATSSKEGVETYTEPIPAPVPNSDTSTITGADQPVDATPGSNSDTVSCVGPASEPQTDGTGVQRMSGEQTQPEEYELLSHPEEHKGQEDNNLRRRKTQGCVGDAGGNSNTGNQLDNSGPAKQEKNSKVCDVGGE